MLNRTNLSLASGEDRTFALKARQSSGAVLDLTGATLTWRLKDGNGGLVKSIAAAISSASLGTYTVSLSDADSLLPAGDFSHETVAVISGVTTLCNAGVLRVAAIIGRTPTSITVAIPSDNDASDFTYTYPDQYAVARTIQTRLAERPSVQDWGADPVGALSATTAFQYALNAAPVIAVPSGRYSVGSLSGGSRKYWIGGEALNSGGTAPPNLPGIYEGVFNGRKVLLQSAGGATDYAAFQLSRTATYSGGTPGFVNAALRISTTTAAGNAAYEWAALYVLDNFATGGQNVACYAQSTKESGAGPTWAFVTELRDKNVSPTGGAVSLEVGLFANGADASNNRIGIDVSIGKDDAAGTQNTTTYGVRVGPTGQVAAAGKVKYGVAVTSTFDNAAFDASQGTQGASGHAFRMADGMKFAFDTSQNRTWFYSGGVIVWQVLGVTKASISLANNASDGSYSIQGNQIIGPRDTGWAPMTGTPNKAAVYDTASVTLAQLAGRVAQMQATMTSHGLTGA